MTATDALADLERRVTEKYAAAAQTRQQPDLLDAFDPSSWSVDLDIDWVAVAKAADASREEPSADLPQFPREQWVTHPHRRTVLLMVIDRYLDLDLTEDDWRAVSWLMAFGGRERIA